MSLYTPFLADATEKVGNAYMQKQAGQLAQRAYMGDEEALGALYRLDPNSATQIRNQRLQEEQAQLQRSATNLQMDATRQNMQQSRQSAEQSAQQFALQNREALQSILQGAAAFETYEEALPYIAGQIESLKASGVQVPPDLSAQTFTPEIFAQIKQLNAPKGESYTLAEGAERYGPDGKLIASNAKEVAPVEPKVFQETSALRQEFSAIPLVKDFSVQSQAYGRIEAAAADPSPAGDLAVIFSYMKVLDPGSTVREGEFANAQNAGSVGDRVISAYNRVLNGERLSEDQRKDFVDRGKRLYMNAEQGFDRTFKQYERIATRRGLPVDEALIDYRYKFGEPQSAGSGDLSPDEMAELESLRARYVR